MPMREVGSLCVNEGVINVTNEELEQRISLLTIAFDQKIDELQAQINELEDGLGKVENTLDRGFRIISG